MQCPDFIGQTLDGKYQMTRELGRGGMGTVYLATHLGTERPVAVKIIAPQFMERAEFVERFRREARAAGRLRHPNVVDVTDFGFAPTKDGQVAYLVMEYLDGCTLGEILDEEHNLPVAWTLDILEQVCSAVQEAHGMGIIHRDLKPDNIWLEPNQRGGYTVKVLDFGIAKLEEHEAPQLVDGDVAPFRSATPTFGADSKHTFAGLARDETQAPFRVDTHVAQASTIVSGHEGGTLVGEAGTILLEPAVSEGQTAIITPDRDDQDTINTRMLSEDYAIDPDRTGNPTAGDSWFATTGSKELTRVGAVLGTPLYMSPEQCRGEHLDTRSDIYSLGVIAYQMLSGAPPFQGEFQAVMDAHKTFDPPPLAAKKVRKKMKRAIYSALAKDPEDRPHTAEAFASELRSRSEGIFGLLRRAMVIYSEHLPKFLALTTLLYLPAIILTLLQVGASFLRVSNVIPEAVGTGIFGVSVSLLSLIGAFCTTLIIGMIVWIVSQYLSVPLRPIRLRPALYEVKKKWKTIAGGGALAALGPFLIAGVAFLVFFVAVGGLVKLLSMAVGVSLYAPIVGAVFGGIAAIVMFFISYVWCILISPVVMMEPVKLRAAFARSRQLTRRAFTTSLAAALIMFLIPMTLAGVLSVVVNATAKGFDIKMDDGQTVSQSEKTDGEPSSEEIDAKAKPDRPPPLVPGVRVNLGADGPEIVPPKPRGPMSMQKRVMHTVLESLIQIFWLPIQIVVISFTGIIVALLYIKTRLAGGESMDDLIERFEDDSQPRKKWQERVRQRLIQSGRISSNPSR